MREALTSISEDVTNNGDNYICLKCKKYSKKDISRKMDKEERMFKSYLARKKRKNTKEIVKTVEKIKRADARNLKKKNKKIKKRQQKVLFSD